MQYTKIYNKIVEYRKNNLSENSYTEKHHIIPVCLGGTNKKDNLVVVTSREHYILHHLLMKIYPENKSLLKAFRMLRNRLNVDRNSNPYSCIRKSEYNGFSEEHKRKISENSCRYWKGKHLPKEIKQKISESHKGKKFSEEHKQKLSESKKGKSHSEETKQKMSESMKASMTEEVRKKISESCKGKKCNPFSEKHKQKLSDSAKNRIGKIFVNNGIIAKLVFPNEIPEGFVKGRLKRKN